MASGDTLCIFTARDGIPSATAGATHAILTGAASPAEGVPYLAYDSATDENADFIGIMPRAYAGGGLTLTLYWASGVTTGDVVWNAAFRRIQDDAEDIDTTAHSYDFNAVTATTASAAGEVDYATITFTNGADMDSLAVGELFNLRITRDANNGSDGMSGDAYLIAVEIKET
jgi:hypothetical protein